MTRKECGDRGVDQDKHPNCEKCILKKYGYLCSPTNTCSVCVDTSAKAWRVILSSRAKKLRYRELVQFRADALKVTGASDPKLVDLPTGETESSESDSDVEQPVAKRLVRARHLSWTSDSSYDSSTTSRAPSTSMSDSSLTDSSVFSMAPKTRNKGKALSKMEQEMMSSVPTKRTHSTDDAKRRKVADTQSERPYRPLARQSTTQYEREAQHDRRPQPSTSDRYYESEQYERSRQLPQRGELNPQMSESFREERSPRQPPPVRRYDISDDDDDVDFQSPPARKGASGSKSKPKHRDAVDKATKDKKAEKVRRKAQNRDQADEQYQRETFSDAFRSEQANIQQQINEAYSAGQKSAVVSTPRKAKRKVVVVEEPQRTPKRKSVKDKPLPDFSSSEEEDELPDLNDDDEEQITPERVPEPEAEAESSESEEDEDEEIGFKTILKFMAACSFDAELIELTDDGYKSSIVLKSSQKLKENKFYGLTTSSSLELAVQTWTKSFKARDQKTADKPLKYFELFQAKQGRPGMKPYKSGDDTLPAQPLRQPSARFTWAKTPESKISVAQSDISYLEEVGREGLRILSFLEILNQAINRALTDKMTHKILQALHNSSKAASKDLLLVNLILTGACVQLKRDNFLSGCTDLDASQKQRLRHSPWEASTDLFNPALMEEIDKEHVRFLQSKSMSSRSSDKSRPSKAKPAASASRGNQR